MQILPDARQALNVAATCQNTFDEEDWVNPVLPVVKPEDGIECSHSNLRHMSISTCPVMNIVMGALQRRVRLG